MYPLRDKYELKNLEIRKLQQRYFKFIKNFESYNKDLVEFLKEDALRTQDMAISTTFLFFDKKNYKDYSNEITRELHLLGYVTILSDGINLDSTLKKIFLDKGIEHKSLPALKIGRLCVDNKFSKKNLGTCILSWCVKRAIYMNKLCACRFITLDAKRHKDKEKDSYHFYRKFKFETLKCRKNRTESDIFKQTTGTTSMYLDLFQIILHSEYKIPQIIGSFKNMI